MIPIVKDGRRQRPAVPPELIDAQFLIAPPSPVVIPDFTLTSTDATRERKLWRNLDSNPSTRLGRTMRVFIKELRFSNYFSANPAGGHLVVMLRANLDALTPGNPLEGKYRGVGVIFGNVFKTATNEAPSWRPHSVVQTWGIGITAPTARFLFPDSASAPLQDNVSYQVAIESTLGIDGNRYVGFSIYILNMAKESYDLVWNTGWILDNNPGVDMQLTNLALADSSVPNLGVANEISIRGMQVSFHDAPMILPNLTGQKYQSPVVLKLDEPSGKRQEARTKAASQGAS